LFNIAEFKGRGVQYGARPTQFAVDVFVPFSSTTTNRIRFACRAASVPNMSVDPVSIPYFGREIQVPGDRSFQPWTVTIQNEHDYAVRILFENWNNRINALVSNRIDPAMFPTGYKGEAVVTQFRADGQAVRSYRMEGAWPMNIDTINLDWEAKNQVEQFDITFAYDLWVPDETVVVSVDDFSPILPDDNTQAGVG
jgi:hypothetical protein